MIILSKYFFSQKNVFYLCTVVNRDNNFVHYTAHGDRPLVLRKLDATFGELPLWPLVKETWQWCNGYMNLSEIDGDKPEALLIRRVPYYGINISAPFIVMRHWDEWNEKKTFKIDKKDIALCQLVMDIQHYSQKMYFGKYAEMYFDEKRRDEEVGTVHRKRKTDSYFRLLNDKFCIEDLIKVGNISKKTALNVVSRWMSERKLASLSMKKGLYVKAK